MKTIFTDISPRAWEHPADRAALTALRAVPGLDTLVKFFVGFTGEASLRLLFLSSAVRVGPKQFPRAHRLTEEACRILDIYPLPEVYVTQNPVLNAGAVGVNKPFITLNSSLVQSMDDDELLAVIAHEAGHIASGHVLYKTLLWLIVNAGLFLVHLPVGQLALFAIVAALREWDRKSELSADRAGLLVTQNAGVNYRVLMKLAGGTQIEEMDIDEFFAQAADYDASGTVIDSFHKLLNIIGQSHPFPVLRLTELKTWVENGAYDSILGGDYERRGGQHGPKEEGGDANSQDQPNDDSDRSDRPEGVDETFKRMAEDIEHAQKEYREELRRSKDPLAQALTKLGDGLEKSASDAKSFFDNIFRNKQ